MGSLSYSDSCGDTLYPSYSGVYTGDLTDKWNTLIFPNNGQVVTACPAEGYSFKYWLIDGVRPSATEASEAQLYKWRDWVNFASGSRTLTITAVFEETTAHSATFSVSDDDLGELSAGWDCNGTKYSSYTSTSESASIVYPNNGQAITACPKNGMDFVGWSIDSSPTLITNQTLYGNNWAAAAFGDNLDITVEAIFGYGVTIDAGTGTAMLGSGAGYDALPDGQSSSAITVIATESGVATSTIAVTPPSGYEIDSSNPVTTTGDVVYNGDYSNGSFTLTLNGEGTASINYLFQGYQVEILTEDSQLGTIRIASGTGYTATPDNQAASQIVLDVTSDDTVQTSALYVTPVAGYGVASVVATSGNVTINSWNAGEYYLQFNNEATILVSFEELEPYVATVSVNDITKGGLVYGEDCSATKYESYVSTSYDQGFVFPEGVYALTACPKDGFTFGGWLVNSAAPASGADTAVLSNGTEWLYDGTLYVNQGHTATIQAVFLGDHRDYDVVFQLQDTEGADLFMDASSQDYSVNPNGVAADSLTVTANSADGAQTLSALQVLLEEGWEYYQFSSSTGSTTLANYDETSQSLVFNITGEDVVTISLSDQNGPLATFTTNDASSGNLAYLGWNSKCENGEPHADRVSFGPVDDTDYVDLPYYDIIACPVNGMEFLGWSLDGGLTFVSTSTTVNRWADYTWLNFANQNKLRVTAVFSTSEIDLLDLPETGSSATAIMASTGVLLTLVPSAQMIKVARRKDEARYEGGEM